MAHPLVAIGLCVLAGVAGVAAVTQYREKSIWESKVRGLMIFSVASSVLIFALLEAPDWNNWVSIGACMATGFFLNLIIVAVESELPGAVRGVLYSVLSGAAGRFAPKKKDPTRDE